MARTKSTTDSSANLGNINLALRGIEADFGPENADTFRPAFPVVISK